MIRSAARLSRKCVGSVASRTMKAAAVRDKTLVLEDRPIPTCGPKDVLVKVSAAGVNRPDVLQRLGLYNPPAGTTDIPGLEIAGTVVEAGAEQTRWHAGDQVCALVAGGGYAEYCAAPAVQCLPLPGGLCPVEAACLPETVFTVFANVFQRGALQPGQWLLVHGGSSGIGTTAIQMAVALGSHVITTCGSQAKCAACLGLGADAAFNYRDLPDWVQSVKDRTPDGRGVDVILDMVGGSYTAKNLECLAPDGRLVQIAFLEGSKVQLDLRPVMQKRLTITGSTLRPLPEEQKGALARAVEALVWPLVAAGRVRPLVHASFPLARAQDSHALMESSAHIGKLVLTVP
eukprot:gnl/Hemi2/11392_TR3949_c0_g1_i1.p1 gnl/Hemi2/11392_TR3949_c0_g1~~gnl/Hemi2/11392_TR3949_c0_g1_i1.p1  ORF type:complete len:345 (-),score=100.33 gnl/Hemi2/11392_TR3949_c0_g1_i1:258-1292(-)